MKLLNGLCDRYSQEFMSIISTPKKYDSLAYLTSPKLKDVLDKKWRAYNFELEKPSITHHDLGEKTGEDFEISRPQSTKDFLNE